MLVIEIFSKKYCNNHFFENGKLLNKEFVSFYNPLWVLLACCCSYKFISSAHKNIIGKLILKLGTLKPVIWTSNVPIKKSDYFCFFYENFEIKSEDAECLSKVFNLVSSFLEISVLIKNLNSIPNTGYFYYPVRSIKGVCNNTTSNAGKEFIESLNEEYVEDSEESVVLSCNSEFDEYFNEKYDETLEDEFDEECCCQYDNDEDLNYSELKIFNNENTCYNLFSEKLNCFNNYIRSKDEFISNDESLYAVFEKFLQSTCDNEVILKSNIVEKSSRNNFLILFSTNANVFSDLAKISDNQRIDDEVTNTFLELVLFIKLKSIMEYLDVDKYKSNYSSFAELLTNTSNSTNYNNNLSNFNYVDIDTYEERISREYDNGTLLKFRLVGDSKITIEKVLIFCDVIHKAFIHNLCNGEKIRPSINSSLENSRKNTNKYFQKSERTKSGDFTEDYFDGEFSSYSDEDLTYSIDDKFNNFVRKFYQNANDSDNHYGGYNVDCDDISVIDSNELNNKSFADEHDEIIKEITGCDAEGNKLNIGQHGYIIPTVRNNKIIGIIWWSPNILSKRDTEKIYKKIHIFNELFSLNLVPCSASFLLFDILSSLAFSQMVGSAKKWVSLTPYVPANYVKKNGKNSLEGQVKSELLRLNLPIENINITILNLPEIFKKMNLNRGIRSPKQDYKIFLQLDFSTSVLGPIAIGYGAHFGLGTFKVADTNL